MASADTANQMKKKGRVALRERWSAHLHEREEQVFLLLSLLIGALTGMAVVAFIVLTERLGMRLYPVGSAAWRRVLIPIAGSLAMGFLLFRYFPNARGSGVPQTKAALFARDGFISLRTVLGKFFCTATTLASGIPLGREGPSVQVGAGIGSVLGRALGLSPEKVKALIPVGAAAAIAAAFNTPMAAVLFALEEVMGDLNAPVLGSVVLASATSWAMLRLLLGNNPLFQVPQYELVHPLELGIYALLGIAGGFLSVAFTKMLLGMRKYFLHLPRKTWWWHPVVGGVTVGLMGWFVPQVLGVGYTYVGNALNGTMALKLLLLLDVYKRQGESQACDFLAVYFPHMANAAIFANRVHFLATFARSTGLRATTALCRSRSASRRSAISTFCMSAVSSWQCIANASSLSRSASGPTTRRHISPNTAPKPATSGCRSPNFARPPSFLKEAPAGPSRIDCELTAP